MRKITFHKTRWNSSQFATPYINIINSKGYIQISFVFWNYHFWIMYYKKQTTMTINMDQDFISDCS